MGRLDITTTRPPLTIDEIRRGIETSNAARGLIRRDFTVELVEGGRVIAKRLRRAKGGAQ